MKMAAVCSLKHVGAVKPIVRLSVNKRVRRLQYAYDKFVYLTALSASVPAWQDYVYTRIAFVIRHLFSVSNHFS